MNTSPFDPCVWQLLHSLDRTTHLLRIAQRHLSAGGASLHSTLLAARLAPDMLHLAHQVEVLADAVVGSVALLAGADHVATGKVFNRGEDLLPYLHWRTLDDALDRVAIAQSEAQALATAAHWVQPDAVLTVRRPGNARQFVATVFAERYAVPNALFHLSMVYALLRANGVPIGKADFGGPDPYTLVH
ncbi:DUF1993 family protein [Rhodoferax saidenbachensis]|uniref:DUF1993 domain-containing protein n=1 Tax=Rhodoferax saidenbachensis TaxID=1484693 RepID=A0ABU1ZL13_9BURK|nr:DUF1993 family protein [Rhodoferax saidenbachensis]MDR7306242.1 hypothetical protein [Rhodoferax saidenbachensis]